LKRSKASMWVWLIIAVVALSSLTSVIVFLVSYRASPSLPVELADLKIEGQDREASIKNGKSGRITFTLKNIDGKSHQITVIFNLTTEGIRHVSITDLAGQELPKLGTTFQYGKTIGSTDPKLDQEVLALTKMAEGLETVKVRIGVYLLIDGKTPTDPKDLSLTITK